MIPDSPEKRKLLISAAVFLLLAGMLVLSGCTTQPATTPATPTPTPTAVPTTAVPTTSAPIGTSDMKVYNETANGTTVKIPLNGGCIVRLAENPTTGYTWNATVTSGLAIANDTYQTSPNPQGMVGVGGIHSWTLKGTAAGEQTFSAIYKRSWENVTASDQTFVLHITVEKP